MADWREIRLFDGDLWGWFYRDCFENGSAVYQIRRDDGLIEEMDAAN